MSVVVNSDNSWLGLTTGLFDYNAAYSCCFWCYVSANSNYHGILTLAYSTTTANKEGLNISTTNNVQVSVYNASSGSIMDVAVVSNATWYAMALVRSSATSLKAYVGESTATHTQDVTGRTAQDRILFGNYNHATTYELNGRLAHVKIWTAALTADEIKNEMRSIRPVRQTNLWAWYPMIAGT